MNKAQTRIVAAVNGVTFGASSHKDRPLSEESAAGHHNHGSHPPRSPSTQAHYHTGWSRPGAGGYRFRARVQHQGLAHSHILLYSMGMVSNNHDNAIGTIGKVMQNNVRLQSNRDVVRSYGGRDLCALKR